MDKIKSEQTNNDNLEILLTQLVQEQKQQSKTINDVVSVLNKINGKLDHLQEKIENRKEVQPNIDINPLKEILKSGLTDLRLIVSGYPKSTTKKFQILLFPEQDATLFYKIVFGRWFMWLGIMLVLSLAYKWIIHREDNNKQMMIETLKNEKIIKAWDYLYSQNNTTLHRLLDSALKKSDFPSQ